MANGIPPGRIPIYAQKAMEASPKVLARLLDGITDEESDRRPDPERFTIREAVAHLADWEPIWLGRLRAIIDEEDPFLPGYDEGQFAIDNDYAHKDTIAEAKRFAVGRAALVDYIAAVPLESWNRQGRHEEMGAITFAEFISLLMAHDGYHLKQVIEFRYEIAAS